MMLIPLELWDGFKPAYRSSIARSASVITKVQFSFSRGKRYTRYRQQMHLARVVKLVDTRDLKTLWVSCKILIL